MSTAAPLQHDPRPSARLAPPALAAAALTALVLIAPFRVASAWSGGRYPDLAALRTAVTEGFVRLWNDAGAAPGADLAGAAQFWARFHVVKAGLAAALLVALLVLAQRLLHALADRQGTAGRRWALVPLVVAALLLTPLALLVLVANLQGAVAPLSSVLGVLPLHPPSGALAASVEEARYALENGSSTPALEVIRHDFVTYHAAMAALGAVATLALVAAVVVVRRRRRAADATPGIRRLLVVVMLGTVLLAGFLALTTAANVVTALNPAPALAGFLAGGG